MMKNLLFTLRERAKRAFLWATTLLTRYQALREYSGYTAYLSGEVPHGHLFYPKIGMLSPAWAEYVRSWLARQLGETREVFLSNDERGGQIIVIRTK